MNKFNLTGYNLQTKIYWSLLCALSIAALGFSVFGFISFSLTQFAVMAVAILISLIVNQHQPKLPNTRLTVSAHGFIVFWSTLWLGLAGGAFISLASSITAYKFAPKDKRNWLAAIFCSTISAFAAGTAFYLFLTNVAGFTSKTVADNEIQLGWLLAASLIMAAVYYLLNTFFSSVFQAVESEYPFFLAVQEIFFAQSATYGLGIVAALATHFVFIKFDLWFGLVILLVAVIGHLGYRIHCQKLEVKTREISESSRIHLATVEALASAIDARDQVGIGHVRRTQIYAVGIGELLGLSSDEIQALRTGALLHDIGKLGVPDHILNKPGRFTPAEMEKMKIHSSVGAAILEKVNFPYPVVPTVLYHHETWDGTGYPKGLKKDEIPLTARILAVADTYDAMRGARPYRSTMPRDEARRVLLSVAGTQLDPKIVDVFLRNLKRLESEVDEAGLSYENDERNLEMLIGHDTDADESSQGYVEQIKRANREVFALYELARVFSSSLNLHGTLSLFVKKIGELMPFDTCVVYLLNKNGEFATATFAEGKNADDLKGRKVKPGEGATGYVLKKRQPVYNINPGLDFSFYQLDFIQDYTAMASLPLIADEKLIGAVSLYSCELENYQDEHMRLLETISRIGSDAIFKSLQHAETETHALTDPMTNLPNARSLQIQFETEAARAKRSGNPFQLIMLDLDGFKKVNDTFGHKVGDMLLKEVSRVMREQLREYDFLARYAGDEFVAIIPETPEDTIGELCQRIEAAVLGFKLPIGDGRHASVGVSIGSSCYPKSGETLDQVIIAADHQMYSVKATHKQKQQDAQEAAKEAAAAQQQQQQQQAVPPKVAPIAVQPIPVQLIPVEPVEENIEITEESFIVELDESHIISTAIN